MFVCAQGGGRGLEPVRSPQVSRAGTLTRPRVVDTAPLGPGHRHVPSSSSRHRRTGWLEDAVVVEGRWRVKMDPPLQERLRRQGGLIGGVGGGGGGDGPRTLVRLGRGRVAVRHEVRFSGDDAIVRGVLRLRVAVLRMVKLLAHHVVQRAALEVQYLLERPSEVSIQRGVDYLR